MIRSPILFLKAHKIWGFVKKIRRLEDIPILQHMMAVAFCRRMTNVSRRTSEALYIISIPPPQELSDFPRPASHSAPKQRNKLVHKCFKYKC